MKEKGQPSIVLETQASFNCGLIEKLVNIIVGLQASEGRAGGVFSVYDIRTKDIVTKSFGDYPDGNVSKYFQNSIEKIIEAMDNPQHLRSFQSRDEKKGMLGGGVKCGNLICAFSGFPEKLNEALSFIYAVLSANNPDFTDYDWILTEQTDKYQDNEFIMPIFTELIDI